MGNHWNHEDTSSSSCDTLGCSVLLLDDWIRKREITICRALRVNRSYDHLHTQVWILTFALIQLGSHNHGGPGKFTSSQVYLTTSIFSSSFNAVFLKFLVLFSSFSSDFHHGCTYEKHAVCDHVCKGGVNYMTCNKWIIMKRWVKSLLCVELLRGENSFFLNNVLLEKWPLVNTCCFV